MMLNRGKLIHNGNNIDFIILEMSHAFLHVSYTFDNHDIVGFQMVQVKLNALNILLSG